MLNLFLLNTGARSSGNMVYLNVCSCLSMAILMCSFSIFISAHPAHKYQLAGLDSVFATSRNGCEMLTHSDYDCYMLGYCDPSAIMLLGCDGNNFSFACEISERLQYKYHLY